MTEQWKQIEDYPNYWISDLGNVFNRKLDCPMKVMTNERGYIRVALRNDKGRKKFFVHRLVLEAFTEPNDELEVNHINHVRNDNRLDNLEWCDKSQNTNDRLSSCGYEFTFTETLPEDAKPFTTYNNHEFIGYYVSGNQIFKFIRDNRYRVLDVRYNKGYPNYLLTNTNGKHVRVPLSKLIQ